jgi:hypothetical protein
MFDQLFERPHVLARQLSAPLVEERGQYLFHCQAQEFSRSSLRLTAHLLLATTEYLKLGDRPGEIITLGEIEEAGLRWSQRESLLPIENPRLSCQRFVHSASGWLASSAAWKFRRRQSSPTTIWSMTSLSSCGRSGASRLPRLSCAPSQCGPFWIGSVQGSDHSTPSPSLTSIPLWPSR